MNKHLIAAAISISFLFLLASCQKKETRVNLNPKMDGYVSNAETATKIAEAVWLPIYGEGIYDKKPFKAELKDSIWIVEGTVSRDKLGGAPYMRIQKKDGKILEVTHFQ